MRFFYPHRCSSLLPHCVVLLLCGSVAPAAVFGQPVAEVERLPPPVASESAPRRLPALEQGTAPNRRDPQKLQTDPIASEPQGSLSLSDLEAIAFANNPTLAQSAAEISAASGRYVQYSLAPNPVIGYQSAEIGDEGTAGQQGLFINQEFVRRQKMRLARAVGSREVALAQQAAAIQQLRLLNDVRCEHFNVLIAERARVLAKHVHLLSIDQLTKTQKLYEKKQVPYHDILQARIQAHAAHIAIGNAENRYLASWRRLASLLGTPSLQPRTLEGSLDPEHIPLDWDAVLAHIYARSPQLARVRANVNWKRTVLAQTKAAMQPNLLAVAGMQQDTESDDLIGNIQLGLPLPIFNQNQGSIQEAYAELRKAELDVERTKLAIRSQLASTYETYMNAWHEVNQYTHHILPDAREAVDLVVRGYERREFDILTLLNAERTYAKANLAYLKSLQELGITRIVIDGSLLVGSLRENSQAVTPDIDVSFSPAFGPGVIPVETDQGN